MKAFGILLLIFPLSLNGWAGETTCVVRGRVPETTCAACLRVDCGDNFVGKVLNTFRPDGITLQTAGAKLGGGWSEFEAQISGSHRLTILEAAGVQDLDGLRAILTLPQREQLRGRALASIDGVSLSFKTRLSPANFLFQDSQAHVAWNRAVHGATHSGWRCDWADLEAPKVVQSDGMPRGYAVCTGKVSCWQDARRGRDPASPPGPKPEGVIACPAQSRTTCPRAVDCAEFIDVKAAS